MRTPTGSSDRGRRTDSRFASRSGNPYKRARHDADRLRRSGPRMAKHDVLVLIPARMASTRLPGKPLADIAGKPMIVHVLRRAQEAGVGPVVVATDSEAIAAAVAKAGGRAVMTRGDHATGSDRMHEALALLDPERRGRHRAQRPGRSADPCAARHQGRARAAFRPGGRHRHAGRGNPHRRRAHRTRTWSRWSARRSRPAGSGRSISPARPRLTAKVRCTTISGSTPIRRAALDRFVALPPSPLEQQERLEQLRALEAGMRIDVRSSIVPLGVDTPDDLEAARASCWRRLTRRSQCA